MHRIRFLRVFAVLAIFLATSSVQAETVPPAPIPSFHVIAPAWFTPLSFPLDTAWAAFGYPDRGTTYYSSAAPLGSSSYWDRFNPESDRYEAWFGAYVIADFAYASEWSEMSLTTCDIAKSVQHLQDLAVADQFAWQTAYGDPAIVATITPGSVYVHPVEGRWFAMGLQLQSHTDVGGTIPAFSWYPPYAQEASRVTAYANTTFNTFYLFTYDAASKHLLVKFFSGTEWTTLDGVHHVTPRHVYLEMFQMFSATTFH
jgi:hypothetical protein